MSGSPTDAWKQNSKCSKCLEANPNIGKATDEEKARNKKIAKFKKDRCNNKLPSHNELMERYIN